jgi:hypothetical protein
MNTNDKPEMTEEEIAAAEKAAGEANEQRNNNRLEMFNAIADQAEEDEQLDDTSATDDEPPAKDKEEAEDLVDDGQHAVTPKMVVDGVEVELTPDFIRHAQKIAKADKYLEDAKRQRFLPNGGTGNPATRQGVGSDVQKVDFREVAARLQTGTTEEIAEALEKIAAPQVDERLIYQKAQEAIEYRQAVDWVQEEYKDLFANERLRNLLTQEDDRLIAQGFEGSFKERFKAAGEEVRALVEELGGSTKQSNRLSEKEELVNRRPKVATRSVKPGANEDDSEEDPRSVIASMRKKRVGY